MQFESPLRVAVIGAGIAGASCARALASAGHAVTLFDKARGPGGRLATRRATLVDAIGGARITRFDHGAPAFTAHSPAFRAFVEAGVEAGCLGAWSPIAAAQGWPLDEPGPHFLPVPDMPSLCRYLLEGLPARYGQPVEALSRLGSAWRLSLGGASVGPFDTVLLALPSVQAASLLAGHRRDWAQRATLALMQPCWTLMGVALADAAPSWHVLRPEHGPLASVARNEARPGREARAGEVHWVAHARPAWSREQLERPAEAVQGQLQAALAEVLGEPVRWQWSAVHRWRYAMPHPSGAQRMAGCWWDPSIGLGVCGDFFGGHGVEGAWSSASMLASAVAADADRSPGRVADPAFSVPVQPAAR